jgi:hypothetical protein
MRNLLLLLLLLMLLLLLLYLSKSESVQGSAAVAVGGVWGGAVVVHVHLVVGGLGHDVVVRATAVGLMLSKVRAALDPEAAVEQVMRRGGVVARKDT